MKKVLTPNTFDSKRFLKVVKKRFDKHILLSRFLITKRSKEADIIVNQIMDILTKSFEKNTIFSSGNFFYIISTLEMFFDFSDKFRESIFSKHAIELINDSQNIYLEELNKLLANLKENYLTPKQLPKEEVEKSIKEFENGK